MRSLPAHAVFESSTQLTAQLQPAAVRRSLNPAMEKIKSVLSGGHRKSEDATAEAQTSRPNGFSGEGTHLGSTASTQGAKQSDSSTHPIYDEFTGHDQTQATGDQTKAVENTEKAGNAEKVVNTESATTARNTASPTTTSSLSPNTAQNRPTSTLTDEASTASIRSGVIGFGQTKEQHAALPTTAHQGQLDQTQVQAPASHPGQTHHGRDAALGAGAVGAGAAAAHELSRKRSDDNLKSPEQTKATAMPTFQQSSNRDPEKVVESTRSPTSKAASAQQHDHVQAHPETSTTTARSFPLAGGVASQKQAEPTASTRDTVAHPPVTSEREPGTKERQAGVAEGHGREDLAGAAAAYAAHPHSEGKRVPTDSRGVAGAGIAQPHVSGSEPKTERDLRSKSEQTPAHGSHNPEAIAAAVAASSASSDSPSSPSGKKKWDGTWKGKQEVDSIDPCDEPEPDRPADSRMFTTGPHLTDTANRYDPHLHVPGEFPETPSENVGDKTQTTSSSVAGGRFPHDASSNEPSITGSSAHHPQSDHHYGRDAALGAGALGAGAVAYETGKHHDQGLGNESLPTERSPYSSQQIDPRVDARQPGGLGEQRFDPSAATKSASTNTSTGISTGPVGGAADKPSATTHTGTTEPTSNFAKELEKGKEGHHYGRDAALAGGAVTAGGLAYAASQRDDKPQPESGPASSTIGPHKSNIANILDPRVQPDPALQKHHEAGPTAQDPASATVGPHKSNLANVVDPRVQPKPEKQKGYSTTEQHQPKSIVGAGPTADAKTQPENQHHYGRDAALGAAGAGTAAEAAHQYSQHRSTQPSAALDNQRYDPTARSAPAQGKLEPGQDHHYGRDAAVAGGAGGGVAGLEGLAHEQANKNKVPDHLSTGGTYGAPTGQASTHAATSGTENVPSKSDPSTQQHHYGRDAALAGGAGAGVAGLGALAHEHAYKNKGLEQPSNAGTQNVLPGQTTTQNVPGGTTNAPIGQTSVQAPTSQQQQQHHYNRDAAIAGGAGVAGVGAYEHELEKNKGAHHSPTTGAHSVSSTQAATQPHGSKYQPISGAAQQPGTHQRFDSVQKPEEHGPHKGREAAAAAGAAGAAGAGAYAYDHDKQAKEAAKAEKAHEKELEKQQKQHQKELDKNEKAFHAEQKKLEKQHTKEEKEHNKLVAAENKKHEKEARQAEKEQEKESHQAREAAAAAGVAGAAGAGAYAHEHDKEKREAEKAGEKEEEEKEGKKKHHLFGFLHRDKSKKSPSSSPRASGEQSRTSHDHPSTTAAAYEGNLGEGRNRLHKDPPEGHPAREALASGAGTHDEGEHLPGKHEHVGIDGPIGNLDQISGDYETRTGVEGAHNLRDYDNLATEEHTGLPTNPDKSNIDNSSGIEGSKAAHGTHLVGTEHHGATN